MERLAVKKYRVDKTVFLKSLSKLVFFSTVKGVIHEVNTESFRTFLLLTSRASEIL